MKTGFWRQFCSSNNEVVNTPYTSIALAFFMATPVIALSSAAVIYHVFIRDKGLDGPTVNLLLGMLGAATGGVISAGASMFSKTMAGASTMFSKTTVVSQTQQPDGEQPKAKPAPTVPS